MSLKVIEINDSAVRVSDKSGLIMQSPGFALIGDRGLEVGTDAEKQARLQPTSSFNKFWHQLSMEPLNYSAGNVRHFADLAYAHLLHISKEAEIDGDVIIAAPGNFTSQQLSILLGLSSQCPFNTLGIVDAALASAVKYAKTSSLIFADIQLHQALLTKFTLVDGELKRESVIQIPEVGIQNFMDLTMQLATGLFIQQCRFNPQHNAESEQQLYNALPAWLNQSKQGRSSLVMEIKTACAVHQAKLPWERLVQKLEDFYKRINQQISALSGDNSQLLISSSLAALPDFTQMVQSDGEVQIVTPETLGLACIELQNHINSSGDGIHFVTSLPLPGGATFVLETVDEEPATKPKSEGANESPTHVLFESYALPIGMVAINNEKSADAATVNGSSIRMALSDMPDYLGQIGRENDQVFLLCGEAGAIINGNKVKGKNQLLLGDCIEFSENGSGISLIKVQNGIK